MVTMLVRPEVADYLDVISHASDLELLVDQIPLQKHPVWQTRLWPKPSWGRAAGITVLACTARGGMNLRPGADTLIEPGTRLIVLGTRDQLQALIAASR